MANNMKAKKKMTKDTGLTSKTNFPGEIQQKTPVKPVKAKGIGMGYGILPREQGIAQRLVKATSKK